MSLSIIVPVLNEASGIVEFLIGLSELRARVVAQLGPAYERYQTLMQS